MTSILEFIGNNADILITVQITILVMAIIYSIIFLIRHVKATKKKYKYYLVMAVKGQYAEDKQLLDAVFVDFDYKLKKNEIYDYKFIDKMNIENGWFAETDDIIILKLVYLGSERADII